MMVLGQEPRQTTSNLGHLKPSFDPSLDPWAESTLLFHLHQLQEESTRTEDATESTQEIMDGWAVFDRLQRTLFDE